MARVPRVLAAVLGVRHPRAMRPAEAWRVPVPSPVVPAAPYRWCRPCQVKWRGDDPACWSCGQPSHPSQLEEQ